MFLAPLSKHNAYHLFGELNEYNTNMNLQHRGTLTLPLWKNHLTVEQMFRYSSHNFIVTAAVTKFIPSSLYSSMELKSAYTGFSDTDQELVWLG